ncbi:unnamed protein product, partial [Adineta ricciae]
MSSCLTPHPSRLIERLNVSILTIKWIRKNCFIFENILFDEDDNLERFSVNLNRYQAKFNRIFPLTSQVKTRSEYLTKLLYELECLTIRCSVWLKNNSTKAIRSRLKHFGKRLDMFIHWKENAQKMNVSRKFSTEFSIFQTNYQQFCVQMDNIQREYLNLFFESIELFAKIIPTENPEAFRFSRQNIDKSLNEWKEQNRFHIPWLPDEHQQPKETDIEIKVIDNSAGDHEAKYVHKSNLSWSFIAPEKEEELPIVRPAHSQVSPVIKSVPINRVR